MPILTCFRIRPESDGPNVAFETLLASDAEVAASASTETRVFTATVFIAPATENPPAWAPFLTSAFSEVQVTSGVHPSAVLFVRTAESANQSPVTIAFTFGPAGRFMIDPAAYVRGYGLKTALNLIYPSNSRDTPRLRSVDSKRRDSSVLRSRVQSSADVDFEAFDVSQLRDVLDKAVGQPYDPRWGQRVQGGDALVLNLSVGVGELGKLCRDIEKVSRRDDYRAKFAWIDNIQPVSDPRLKERIENEIIALLKAKELSGIGLTPPEILDWSTVSGFRYHFDRKDTQGGVRHPDLRIEDYVRGLERTLQLPSIDLDYLRRSQIYPCDVNGDVSARWPVWRCLVAELEVDGESYILDEGELFRVNGDYLTDLDQFLQAIPPASCVLPATTVTESEDQYNKSVAKALGYLLLDKQNVVAVPGKTTPIEVCDLLSSDRHLVHVKRHLSSSTLSHLFAQGLVSAELLQTSPAFRAAVEKKVANTVKGKTLFAPLFSAGVQPSEWKVVYAVAAEWRGQGPTRLPFFSKVNLREAYNNLTARGFTVEFACVQANRK